MNKTFKTISKPFLARLRRAANRQLALNLHQNTKGLFEELTMLDDKLGEFSKDYPVKLCKSLDLHIKSYSDELSQDKESMNYLLPIAIEWRDAVNKHQ